MTSFAERLAHATGPDRLIDTTRCGPRAKTRQTKIVRWSSHDYIRVSVQPRSRFARPLYWFGTGASPTLNTSLSSPQTTTLNLNPENWYYVK